MQPGEPKSYILKVTLRNVSKPPVWRRLRVPGTIKFARLHRCIQAAMGWHNCHLHRFIAPAPNYLFPDRSWGKIGHDGGISDPRILQDVVLAEDVEFRYWYDFGDDWWHNVKVECIRPSIDFEPPIWCLDGNGACPPEDCGGPRGFAELKSALIDPKHQDHKEVVEWLNDAWEIRGYDPALFDPNAANERLSRVR